MIPERVTVVEVGPRDGLQNEAAMLPTAEKIALVEALAGAGLAVVETTSFVSPAAVPQLADADQVLAGIRRLPGVRYPVLVPNMRGLERAEASGADAICVFTAATEEFAQANIGMTIAASLRAFAPVLERAAERGMWRRGYVSTAFGCPYRGSVSPHEVVPVAAALLDLGCDQVSIGDTIGVADPDGVRAVVAALLERLPGQRVALHLHDTGGRALDNVRAGLELGIATFDSAVGGAGGCPFAPGAPGNLATESLLALLDELGVEHDVDAAAVAAAGRALRQRLLLAR